MKLSQTLRELAGKATPGPWHGTVLDQGVQIYSDSFDYLGETRDYHGDDAALVVALRNHTPAILAALELQERMDAPETVEVVCKALYRAENGADSNPDEIWEGSPIWDNYIDEAQAAIAAMKGTGQ